VLSATFHRFIPASWYGGSTAWPAVAAIEREIAAGRNDAFARARTDLYRLLRERFSETAAQALTVKTGNLLLARKHLQDRSAVVTSRPFGLVIDPSNMCQLACPGCVHSTRNEDLKVFEWPNGTLLEARFAALLKQYGAYAVGVYFCNYGEPLLNVNTPALIRLSKRYLAAAALSTSLSVRRFDPDAYVESGLDFMVVSLDGATQEVYHQYRRNGDVELVYDNVRRLVDAKRRLRRRTPVLSWNFLAFEHNEHEIPTAAKKARELGFDQFRVVDPFDVSWDDPSVLPAAVKPEVRRQHWRASVDLAGNWNPFPDALDRDAIADAFENGWPDVSARRHAEAGHTCRWLYKNMSMDATGRILPCCGAPRPDAELVFGKFDGHGDPFNSEKYRQARAHFATGEHTTVYCSACDWDHMTVNIGAPEIRRYFRSANPAFFDRRSLRLLSDW
jgi:MoaA/NifB/PqqE/SkfB family radical SAM enzyme